MFASRNHDILFQVCWRPISNSLVDILKFGCSSCWVSALENAKFICLKKWKVGIFVNVMMFCKVGNLWATASSADLWFCLFLDCEIMILWDCVIWRLWDCDREIARSWDCKIVRFVRSSDCEILRLWALWDRDIVRFWDCEIVRDCERWWDYEIVRYEIWENARVLQHADPVRSADLYICMYQYTYIYTHI